MASQDRIRFDRLEAERRSGAFAARITLQWQNGRSAVGMAEDHDTEVGRIRAVAAATARALEQAVDDRVRLRMIGAKTIQAFDAVLVVVALSSRLDEHEQQLVGSCVIKEDAEHAAARAVLSATNRLLGSNLIYLRW